MNALALGLMLLAAPDPQARPREAPPERARLLERAAAAQAAGRSTEAVRHWRAAAERFSSVEALLQLARGAMSGGDAASALADLERAREAAPNSEDVLEAYAEACLALRRPAPALAALEGLARLNPTVAGHRHRHGAALLQAGDFPRAVEELEQAEKLDPQRVATLIALGRAHSGMQRHEAARAALQRALAQEPDNAEARAALAEAERARSR